MSIYIIEEVKKGLFNIRFGETTKLNLQEREKFSAWHISSDRIQVLKCKDDHIKLFGTHKMNWFLGFLTSTHGHPILRSIFSKEKIVELNQDNVSRIVISKGTPCLYHIFQTMEDSSTEIHIFQVRDNEHEPYLNERIKGFFSERIIEEVNSISFDSGVRLSKSDKSITEYFFFPIPLLLLIISALSFLILHVFPEWTLSEVESRRQEWLISILFLIISFNIKTLFLYIFQWGKIRECISSYFKAYSGSLLILFAFVAFNVYGKNSPWNANSDIRFILGFALYVQYYGFYILVPLTILVEGIILQILKKDNPNRIPWLTSISSNITDFLFKILFGFLL